MSPARRKVLMKQLTQLGLTRAKKMIKAREKDLRAIMNEQ